MTSPSPLVDPLTAARQACPGMAVLLDRVQALPAHGIQVRLDAAEQVFTNGLGCSGFFEDRPTPVLAVAVGKPLEDWLAILVHEYCHACQYREGATAWQALFQDWRGQGIEDACVVLDAWLEGACELTPTTLDSVIRTIKTVELDCERRVVALNAELSLGLDPATYAQNAAAYVYGYDRVRETRRWFEAGRAPYQLPEVTATAPRSLDGLDVDRAPVALAQALVEAYPDRPALATSGARPHP